MNLKAKKAVILCRVSSRQQEEGYSLDAQEDRCIEYCKRKDLEVIEVFKFSESSTRGDRPKFNQMLKFVEKQKNPIAIVCDKVDRLERGFTFANKIENLRIKNNVELHFVSECFILTPGAIANEQTQYYMRVIFGKNYTDCISDNVKRSHERMIKEGKLIGLAPIGYKNVRDINGNADVVLDEDRAYLIKKIFMEYSTGLYSLDMIREKTIEWGLRNKRTNTFLSKSQIERILKDPIYCGYATYKNTKYNHCYTTIISTELFKKCENVRLGKKKNYSNKNKENFLFSGLITCKNCGCTITPEIKKKKYIYLRPNTKGDCNCKQINENVANDVVADVLKNIMIPKEKLELFTEKLKERFNQNHKEEKANLNMLTQDLKNLDKRLNRLLDIYMDESITKEEYNKKKFDLGLEKDILESKIKNFEMLSQDVEISLEYLLDVVSRCKFLYESSGIDRKRKILKLVFPNFYLDGQKLGYTIRKPFDEFIKKASCTKNWVWWDSNPRPID